MVWSIQLIQNIDTEPMGMSGCRVYFVLNGHCRCAGLVLVRINYIFHSTDDIKLGESVHPEDADAKKKLCLT